MNYIRSVLSALRKADKDFSLIDDGDRIALGISGGKDSLALLRAMSVYPLFAKKKFEIFPVYLDLGFSDNDLTPLKEYVKSLGYELYVSDSRFVYDVLKAHQKPGKNIPCSICSRMKKAAINKIAKEHHCNKVAFAHHADDAIETLLMNMIHGGRVATFEPKMKLERAGITFIRPLFYCFEKELDGLCREEDLPIYNQGCPANKHTEREYAKNLVKEISSRDPSVKENLRTLLINHEQFCLPFLNLEYSCPSDQSYAVRPILTPDDLRGTALANSKSKEGEVDYLILHKHERVGSFAYRYLDAHKVVIYRLDGEKEAKKNALEAIEKMLSAKSNPLTVIIEGEKPQFLLELGYRKAFDRTFNRPKFSKKINK